MRDTDKKCTETRKNDRSLFYATTKMLLPLLFSTVLPRLCQTAFTFSQPFMINTTVKYMDQFDANPNYGKGLIGAWALVYLGIAVCSERPKINWLISITRIRYRTRCSSTR